HFINRELSWLEFNQRVLDEALNPQNPLLERLKFFCIVSSNLEEFFERRVTKRGRRMVDDQYACWRQDLRPALAQHGIRFLNTGELKAADLAWLESFYHAEVRPVLTPMAIDPAHPFPQLLNKSLNMIVELEMAHSGQPLRHLAVVQVPRVLPRLVKLPRDSSQQDYIFLGNLIGHFLADLFPGATV